MVNKLNIHKSFRTTIYIYFKHYEMRLAQVDIRNSGNSLVVKDFSEANTSQPETEENINGVVNKIADIEPEQSTVLETASEENINSVVNKISDILREQSTVLETPLADKTSYTDAKLADTEEAAIDILEKLNSKAAINLLSSLIFWDEKRPIKTSILNVLDWSRLVQGIQV